MLSHSPGPFSPIMLCRRGMKKCFCERSLLHMYRLKQHVATDVDLKHLSQPFICYLKLCLHSSGIWMGLQMFTLHLCRNGEHTRCRECAGVGSHCGTSPAHRDICRSERLALAQAPEQLRRTCIARGSCQEGPIQHGRFYLCEFPKSKAQAHSSVGLESRSSGADSR